MASFITAGNATNGLQVSSDNTGILELRTGTGSGTTALTLNTSQNAGLGVTPSAWASGVKVFQTVGGSIIGLSNSWFGMGANYYYDGTNNKYTTTNPASLFVQDSGVYKWFQAPSGTANANITFTQAMTLDANGNLLLGSTTGRSTNALGVSQFQIESAGFSSFQMFSNGNNTDGSYINLCKARGGVVGGTTTVQANDILGGIFFGGYNGSSFQTGATIYARAVGTISASAMPGQLEFITTPAGSNNGQERARINSAGDFGINTGASVNAKLDVVQDSASANGGRVAYFRSTAAGDVANNAVIISKFDNNTTTSQIFMKFEVNNTATSCGRINANGANTAAFGSTSDQRVKENIEDLPSQLQNILALRPVEFDYIESYGGGHQIGFIAQEMQEVYPDVVSADESEEQILSITGWSKTEARLVKAIQELNAKVEALEAQLKGTA